MDLMEDEGRGQRVAVKCNGAVCTDESTIDREQKHFELLLLDPHTNILPVYGICKDAPDGKVRLVMKYCEKGSLEHHLAGQVRLEVRGDGASCFAFRFIAAFQVNPHTVATLQ